MNEVTIRWPNGEIETLRNVPPIRLHHRRRLRNLKTKPRSAVAAKLIPYHFSRLCGTCTELVESVRFSLTPSGSRHLARDTASPSLAPSTQPPCRAHLLLNRNVHHRRGRSVQCQCFSPGKNQITWPGQISSTGPSLALRPAASAYNDESLTQRIIMPTVTPRLE